MYGYNPFFRPPQMWGAPMQPQQNPQPCMQQGQGMRSPPQPPQQQRPNHQQYPPRPTPPAGRGMNPPQPSPQRGGWPNPTQNQAQQQGGNYQQPPQRVNGSAPARPAGPPRPQAPEQSAELEIWIVRHGETIENKTRTIAGHNVSGLTPHGHQQAELVAERLRGIKFTAVFISDLVRTQQTAEWILKALGPGHQTLLDRRLREKGAGSYVGYKLGYSEHMAQVHGFSVRHFRPPGNGESWEDVAARGRAFLKEVVDKFCVPPSPRVPTSTIASGASTPQGPRSEAASPLPGKGAAQNTQQQQGSPNSSSARPMSVQGGGSPLAAAHGRGVQGQRPVPPPRSPVFDERGAYSQNGVPQRPPSLQRQFHASGQHPPHAGPQQLRHPPQQTSPQGQQKSPQGAQQLQPGGFASPQPHAQEPRQLQPSPASSTAQCPPTYPPPPGQAHPPPRAHPAQGTHPVTPPAQRGPPASPDISVESVEEHVWDADSPPDTPRSAPGSMVTCRARSGSLPSDSFAQSPLLPAKPRARAGSVGAHGSGEAISTAKLQRLPSLGQLAKRRSDRELVDKEAEREKEELAKAMAKEEEEAQQCNRILLVTHGGFIGEMLAGARCPSQRAPKNCSIHVVHVLRKGPRAHPEFRLKVEQDVEHLKVLTEDNKGHLNHIPTTETPMVPKLRQQGSQKKLVEYQVMFL